MFNSNNNKVIIITLYSAICWLSLSTYHCSDLLLFVCRKSCGSVTKPACTILYTQLILVNRHVQSSF